ncbi:DUF397 domain-containing protein [Streptomyces sp. UNOC14_S4]|uniref:DUF397 domain-containing protein n=1 Tax=Streptomyces sp. UNOC14_S4 TaxID=2872340 RepID=UPI001E5F2216|nr:DUF397 domain-containing protein [Streptomyces sp. UNOC14_S4]MCC3771013.1 DUF397 domain-containing protein [Streptomyces sp. UNOC14_S4]
MSTLQWQKSTFSGGGVNGECIEAAASGSGHHIHLRESERPDTVLTLSPASLSALLAYARNQRTPRLQTP